MKLEAFSRSSAWLLTWVGESESGSIVTSLEDRRRAISSALKKLLSKSDWRFLPVKSFIFRAWDCQLGE
jgi:hypothetical protein